MLLTNPGKLSLVKWVTRFVSVFFPKLPNQKRKDLLYWVILGIWALLRFISVDMLLAKTLLF